MKSPDVKPLIPERVGGGAQGAARARPLSDQPLIVIKDELIAKHPDLAADVFNAFAAVEAGLSRPTQVPARSRSRPRIDKMHLQVMEITGDPLPYGVEPNRKVIEELIRHAMTQGIITKPVTVDALFAPSTRGLAG